MRNIIIISFILTVTKICSQTTFLFAKTIDAKSKNKIGLVDIECYRNDSLFVATTSNLDGEIRLKNEYKFEKGHKYKLIISAIGFQRQSIILSNVIEYPITIILTKKKGENLKTKYHGFTATICVEPRIKESKKIRDSIPK